MPTLTLDSRMMLEPGRACARTVCRAEKMCVRFMVRSGRRRVGTEMRKWVAAPRAVGSVVRVVLEDETMVDCSAAMREAEMSKPMVL